MSIDVTCSQCSRNFRVTDEIAGKRIKCPKCTTVIGVPSASGPSWYVKTEQGKDYGPVSEKELHDWAAEGRLTAHCQILREGAPQWQWATEAFPQLTATAPATPAATSHSDSQFDFTESIQSPAPSDSGPFDFSAADRSPTTRVSGGRKGGHRRRSRKKKSGPRSGLVTTVCVVNFAIGGLQLVSGTLVAFVGPAILASLPDLPPEFQGVGTAAFVVVGLLFLFAATLRLAAGYGVLRRAQWGRILSLVLDSLSAFATASSVLFGNLLAIPFVVYHIFAIVIMLTPKYAEEFK